jgi:hypothetical protein
MPAWSKSDKQNMSSFALRYVPLYTAIATKDLLQVVNCRLRTDLHAMMELLHAGNSIAGTKGSTALAQARSIGRQN